MFWTTKKQIRQHEQYRLMRSVESARRSWEVLKEREVMNRENLYSEIPVLLAEIRYRYLMQQARKRNWTNAWYLE